MTVAKPTAITLEEFLALPETKPACEYIEGEIISKSMSKTRHSRLQGKLIDAINEVAEAQQIAYTFPELRCTFGGRSIIPDVAVFRWQHIRLDENEEPIDNVFIAPDWMIEVRSPEQSSNRVTQQLPELLHQDDPLPVLEGIELSLTVNQVFGWLKMGSG
jgi:Uma2 family endonuclease